MGQICLATKQNNLRTSIPKGETPCLKPVFWAGLAFAFSFWGALSLSEILFSFLIGA